MMAQVTSKVSESAPNRMPDLNNSSEFRFLAPNQASQRLRGGGIPLCAYIVEVSYKGARRVLQGSWGLLVPSLVRLHLEKKLNCPWGYLTMLSIWGRREFLTPFS